MLAINAKMVGAQRSEAAPKSRSDGLGDEQASGRTHLVARDDVIARLHAGHALAHALHDARRLMAQDAATRGGGKTLGASKCNSSSPEYTPSQCLRLNP